VCMHVCVCMCLCVCADVFVCVCMCVCAHVIERDLSTPYPYMQISTMDRLQNWVQKKLGGS